MRESNGWNARAGAALFGGARGGVVNLLVFDMDRVLVDVSESYRETIQQTVEHFTGKRITREAIQEWKNRGGWNDDWALSTAIIRDAGTPAEYDAVVKHFQGI